MPSWDERPVACLTSDVDWASEATLSRWWRLLGATEARVTVFLTHRSELLDGLGDAIDRGAHPNFLPGSSHGATFAEVAQHVRTLVPDATAYRCHRYFDVDDSVLAMSAAGFRYDSNLATLTDVGLRPLRHRLGGLRIPVFWEDGAHLTHGLPLRLEELDLDAWRRPGLKVLNVHPIHVALNSADQQLPRRVKDGLPRDRFRSLDDDDLSAVAHRGAGIATLVEELLAWLDGAGVELRSLDEVHVEAELSTPRR